MILSCFCIFFQLIGFGILSLLLIVALFKWVKYKCYNRELDYYKVILKEEENVLKEILTTAAKEKLTEEIKNKIEGDPWTECFDVAEELIDNNTEPPAAAVSQVMNPPAASMLSFLSLLLSSGSLGSLLVQH